MNLQQLLEHAQRHALETWGDGTGEIGQGHEILAAHGIGVQDATALAVSVANSAHRTDTLPGIAAVFLQGLIFGLWLPTVTQDPSALKIEAEHFAATAQSYGRVLQVLLEREGGRIELPADELGNDAAMLVVEITDGILTASIEDAPLEQPS